MGMRAVLGIVLAAVALAAPAQEARKLSLTSKVWMGDFDAMLERRMIRVLVPYSRTLYFVDKGRERGLTAELAREVEQHINRKYKTGKRPLTVYLIPTTRDKLLTMLAEGHGDIAAGNLTVTPERAKVADFVEPGDRPFTDEVVVMGARAATLGALDDLSGRSVHVRNASSYRESLDALNARFVAEGKAPVELVVVPDALEDEDLMEMANAGLVDLLVVDDWKARMWAKVLQKLRVREDLVLRTDGHVGWAIRKDSPKLQAALADAFAASRRQGAEARLNQYMSRVKQMQDPTRTADYKRFEQTLAIFRKYGARYGFDPLMLAAQGYQESTLDQGARSPVGAIGVMQVMPATGADMRVGDIHVTEPNIHAGTKYLDLLMQKAFPDAQFSEGNRPLFAFAAYNCGPGNMAKMRREAAKRGLDPDKWFNNVELVVAEKIGQETTTYVRNIYKYYVSYRLTLEAQDAQRKARESVARPQ